MSRVDKLIDLLAAGKQLSTDEIADRLDILDKVEAAKLVGGLHRKGMIEKHGSLWRLSKAEKAANEPTISKEAREAVASLDEPAFPVELAQALSDLRLKLEAEPPKFDGVTDHWVKCQTLKRLADLLCPSIGNVLDAIVIDLDRLEELSQGVKS